LRKEVHDMKLILSVLVVTALLASTVLTVSAADILDLSTLNKKPSIEPLSLPRVSPNMPTSAATALGGNVKSDVLDLSTLGKKAQLNLTTTMIKGASAITVTPMFAVKNEKADNQAGSVYTLPQAISSGTIVYTPPIAIFGGA
jgi:hypothetical protein